MTSFQMKKTSSQIYPQPPPKVERVASQQVVPQDRSLYALSLPGQNRQRVPQILHSILRGKASESKTNRSGQEGSPRRNTKEQGVMRSKVKEMISTLRQTKQCEICEEQIKKAKNKNLKVYISDCEHKDSFCESCLHHYTIYKVKSFEEVLCPHEGCPAVLDTSTNFYKNLPADIQKNYKKIHQFYVTSQDPNLRLCPKDDCEGIIKTSGQNVMVCNECERSFCSKCLLLSHEGQCDNEEVKFFQSNLHYRQCKKCKFIIQKNQGCNHIKCRCGFQFCYVCGEKWAPKHYGGHDQNGRLVQAQGNNYNGYEDNDCCDNCCQCQCCQCCNDCCDNLCQCCTCCEQNCCACCNTCCECCENCCECQCCENCCQCQCIVNTCGQTCASVIKAPLKLFLILLFIPLLILVFIGRDFFLTIFMFIACIVAGIFGYSCQVISEIDEDKSWLCCLAILFFPITCIFGIIEAFKDIFCEIMPEMYNQYCQIVREGFTNICSL